MNNKVLINIYNPYIEEYFNIYIPINECIWKINKLIVKSIFDLSNIKENFQNEYILINGETGKIYTSNEIIANTDIKNGTKLILIKI